MPKGDGGDVRPGSRWLLALAFGVAAYLVNRATFPLLSEEAPLFIFGGALVLVAMVVLGPGPGLLSAAVAYLPDAVTGPLTVHPGLGVGFLLYVLEAWVAWWLYRRTRSLALSVVIFWMVGGWALDLLVYRWWVGLSGAYVGVLLLKQILNGVANGAVAELVLAALSRRESTRPSRAGGGPWPLEGYAFNRAALVTMVPLTVLGFVYARAEFQAEHRDVQASMRQDAWGVVRSVEGYLDSRSRALTRLARRLEVSGEAVEAQALLDDFTGRFPDLTVIALTDDRGVVRAASPAVTLAGDSLAGLSVADRRYYRQVLEEGATTFGAFLIGRMPIRSEEREATVVVAEPLLDADGGHAGALVASLGAGSLSDRLAQAPLSPGHRATLVDANGDILGSTEPQHELGQALADFLRPRPDAGGPVLGSLDEPSSFVYYPTAALTLESQVALDLTHGAFQPMPSTGWGVMISLPASSLYPALLPAVGQILAIFAAFLLAMILLTRRATRRISYPIRRAVEAARRITQGQLDEGRTVTELERSDIRELRDLATSLGRMEEALAERARRSQAREFGLREQLMQAQKMEAVGFLAAGVAHDFNNLLTPVMSYAGLAREATDPADRAAYLAEIERAARRGQRITQQLLIFSHREVISQRLTDMVDALWDVAPLIRTVLPDNVELEVDIGLSTAPVLADQPLVHQALMSLAENAVQAMPGGGRLRLGLTRAKDVAGEGQQEGEVVDGPFVVVEVEDTGHGMDEGVVGRCMDPFFTTRPGESTGLGMSTAYGILRQHSGTLRVSSEPGKGTCVRLYFPVLNGEEPENGEHRNSEGLDRYAADETASRGAREERR